MNRNDRGTEHYFYGVDENGVEERYMELFSFSHEGKNCMVYTDEIDVNGFTNVYVCHVEEDGTLTACEQEVFDKAEVYIRELLRMAEEETPGSV